MEPPNEEEPGVYLENVTALEYAQYLKRYKICELIIMKMNDDPVNVRWIRLLERNKNKLEAIEHFILKFQMSNNNKMGVSVNCTLTSVSLKSIFMTLGFRRTRRLLLIKSDLIFNPNFEQDFRSCDDFLKINMLNFLMKRNKEYWAKLMKILKIEKKSILVF